jgi:hypothetical protein
VCWALRYDGSDEERRAILAGAMLAIPVPASFKSETIRFRKSKFGEGGELYTLKDGEQEIWRQPATKLKQRKAQRKPAAKA